MSDPNNLVYRDQLDDNVIDMLSEDIGSNYSLRTENQKTIVAALNEIKGKNMIAGAIGDPLLNTDTYQSMKDKIEGLTNDLKIKLINNNISVAPYDKLKALIEKIDNLQGTINSENLTTGTCDITLDIDNPTYTLNYNLANVPSKVFLCCDIFNGRRGSVNVVSADFPGVIISSENADNMLEVSCQNDGDFSFNLLITDLTAETCNLTLNTYIPDSVESVINVHVTKWYAIGEELVEETSALKESLKEILTNKGVEVTGDESLAELILKVDEIKTGGSLNIISATELPASGIDNQVCVITDNPVDLFTVSSDFSDVTTDTSKIVMLIGSTQTNNTADGTLLELTAGNIITKYYFIKACQGETRLDSYYWLNNQWNQLTAAYLYWLENKIFQNTDYFGTQASGNTWHQDDINGLYISKFGTGNENYIITNTELIDFSAYKTIEMTIKVGNTVSTSFLWIGVGKTSGTYNLGFTGTITSYLPTARSNGCYVDCASTGTYTVDISDITGTGYLGIQVEDDIHANFYIYDIKLY